MDFVCVYVFVFVSQKSGLQVSNMVDTEAKYPTNMAQSDSVCESNNHV